MDTKIIFQLDYSIFLFLSYRAVKAILKMFSEMITDIKLFKNLKIAIYLIHINFKRFKILDYINRLNGKVNH